MKLQISRSQVASSRHRMSVVVNLHPAPCTLQPSLRSAFTLIEIMVVIAILGVVLAMGVPPIFRAMKKEGMRAALSDVLEACQQARSAAILSGTMMELQILPEDRVFRVIPGGQPRQDPSEELLAEVAAAVRPEAAPAPAVTPSFSVQLPDSVWIELLDVNFVELKDAGDVRVRFHPNGTSDEFTVVLRSANAEFRQISLEVTTALPDVKVIR